jgi:flagellar hook-associated protein 3 FlgL
MRISTQVFYQRNTQSMMSQQSKLNQDNLHLSTQKRVITGADDPVAIATIQRLKQQIAVEDQYSKNSDVAETANSLEDTSLTQATNTLQRVRELMVSASNGIHSEVGREAIAKELEGLREELIGVANTRDGNNQYIFSGFNVDTEPFQKNEFGVVDYHGNDGAQGFQIGGGVTVKGGDAGSAVFMNIPNGNGTYLATVGEMNTGAGVINTGSIIDPNIARNFPDHSYSVVIGDVSGEKYYSVYSLSESTVAGNASVKITNIDLSNSTAPEGNLTFTATANAGEFEVSIAPSTTVAIYQESTLPQSITIDGVSLEISGKPADTDQYNLDKVIASTPYENDQSIEFNGMKTTIKGDVLAGDTFTLIPSENKDIFSTIQDSIEALRAPGGGDSYDAKREIRLNMALLQVDGAISNVSEIHTGVGARMRTIDNQRESTQDFKLTSQKTLSNLEDLDMAKAVSDFKMNTNLLEVTQQTFIQMQSLSLFKMI